MPLHKLSFLLLVPSLLVAAPQPATVPARQYAPDRGFDLLHLVLDVTPNFDRRSITGTAKMTLRPIAEPQRQLRLDAVDLRIQELSATSSIRSWHVTTNQLVATFQNPIPPGQDVTVTIRYEAEPQRGLYFRTPAMGYREGEAHLFTQGETITARHWYPCLDAPNERFTSEVICRVPEDMTVFSNGRLISKEADGASHQMAFRWAQEQPHVNYLISLVAGPFKSISDRHGDIPLGFHVLPSEIDQATNSFHGTRDMMAFFEAETGVPYPWAKYDQICVNDFVAGGMENTSLTTLTDGTLFSQDTENLETSESLVAHELAHQWFGDLVTCKDWSHVWLNEGFATYYETLWLGHRHGLDHLRCEMFDRLRSLTANAGDTRPIVRRDFQHPDEMFNHLTYPKASWVLHMIRQQLGDDLYRRCIHTYLERHRQDTVVTEDLNAVLEEVSGRSWDQFFDQWVYHGGYPQLQATYAWDDARKIARVSLTQQQPANDQVLLFRLPLTLRFRSGTTTLDQKVVLEQASQDFEIPLESTPETVRIDPELAILARIQLELPLPMVLAQLADTNDVVGRLLAIEVLARRKDQASVDRLRVALNEDPFYRVRVEAARGLSSIRTEAALNALLASRTQPDARVRLQITSSLGAFYRQAAFRALLDTLEHEQNPSIQSIALQELAEFNKPEVREHLVRLLGSQSYHNELAVAALRACRTYDDPTLVPVVLDTLRRRGSELTAGGFTTGLQTVAFLARHDDNQAEVREFLLAQIEHKRRTIPPAAIRALGTLGDEHALGPLEKINSPGRQDAERDAARDALGQLRERRKPSGDVQNLRQEVLDLQQNIRDLRQQIEELKKRQETPSSPLKSEPGNASPKKKPRGK